MQVSTVCALIAVLCSHTVQATGLQYDPTTPGDEFISLTHEHPAYGAELSSNLYTAVLEPTAPEEATALAMTPGEIDSNTTEDVNSDAANSTARRLEDSSQDIQRLETLMGTRLERNVENLPRQGSLETIPWPASYWPIYQDSINYRWSRGPSPAEKYAYAFGLNVDQFMDTVSRTNGILSMSNRKRCSNDWHCRSLGDGSQCGKRRGERSGHCIPRWFGICHAWAPAAILEDEPRCPVRHNGVVFQPVDIKALITALYDGVQLQTVFTGARFNGPDSPARKDQFGRYRDPARRDLSPGFFHLALTNVLGRYGRSFIVDVSSGAEVWNQPVYSYRVRQSKVMSPTDAARYFFRTRRYPFNNQAEYIMFVETEFKYVVEMTDNGALVSTGRARRAVREKEYKYLLELDGQGNIIGGEWIGGSNEDHPDFLWIPVSRPSQDAVSRLGISYSNVMNLLQQSLTC